MLLIMANLLFVNNVLSKVGRHDTHLLGGGSDFLLGITQDGVCHILVCLSKKHLNLSFCGNAGVQRAHELSASLLICFSSDTQGLTQDPTDFSLHLDQICEKICSRSHYNFHSNQVSRQQ